MKARKKPVIIEFLPCEPEYLEQILSWWTKERPIIQWRTHDHQFVLEIMTLEWIHTATKLDVIIKWVDGEVYPCKKSIFEKTYDVISEND